MAISNSLDVTNPVTNNTTHNTQHIFSTDYNGLII